MNSLQGLEGDVGAAIVARLTGYSTAELEHLFLEFHGELNLVHGILLLTILCA